MKELVVLLGSIFSGLLWMAFVAPLIARAAGVPVRVLTWRFRVNDRHLSRRQWIWAKGVLGFGVGLFVITTTDDFLTAKLLHQPYSRVNFGHLGFSLLMWVIAGALFGDWTWRPKRDGDNETSAATH